MDFEKRCDENNKKTQIPNPDSILFKPTAPTIQYNRVYGYKELKCKRVNLGISQAKASGAHMGILTLTYALNLI